jgi:hypothetical protein
MDGRRENRATSSELGPTLDNGARTSTLTAPVLVCWPQGDVV